MADDIISNKREYRNDLTQEYLHGILDYDKETGDFRWKPRIGVHKSWNTKYAGQIAGWTDSHGYKKITTLGKHYFAHRLAWLYVTGEWPTDEIDHKDAGRSNSFDNFREASTQQNCFNRKIRSDSKSGYKGVHFSKQRKKYEVSLRVGGKRVYREFFDTAEEAHEARCEEIKKYHGEFKREK